MIALLAVLASLYAPVWKPLFSNPPRDVILRNAVVSVTPLKGVLWLSAFVTVANPSSTVLYVDRVQFTTTYSPSPGPRGLTLVESELCPTTTAQQDEIPPRDSIQYSVRFRLPHGTIDENDLRTMLTVLPAFGPPQSTAAIKPNQQSAIPPTTSRYQCPIPPL